MRSLILPLFFDDTLVYQFYDGEIYHCFETDWYTLDIFIKLIFDEDPKISKNALATAVRGYPLFLFENREAILSYYSQYNRPGVENLKEEICNKYLDVLQEQYHGGPYCGGWFPETEKGDAYAKEEYEKQKEAWCPILKTLPPSSRLYCRIKEMLSELAEFLTEEDKDLRMLP